MSSKLSGLAFLLLAALEMAQACASKPPPPAPPPPPPNAAEQVVIDLTNWLNLDPLQQQKALQFAYDFTSRNEAIARRWQQTSKARPDELIGSRGQFQKDILSILTPEQKKIFSDTTMHVFMQGRSAPKPPAS